MSRHLGFTLLELIITMLIIATLVGFAVVRFSGSSGYDEYAYQARLISVLRNMQTRAMNDTRNGFCFQVNFDNANNAFGPPTLNYQLTAPAANTCNSTIDVNNVLTSSTAATVSHLYATSAETSQDNITMIARNSLGNSIAFIGFNHLGMPLTSDAGNDNCASGCTVDFTSSVSTARVCIESQGYVHEGSCGT